MPIYCYNIFGKEPSIAEPYNHPGFQEPLFQVMPMRPSSSNAVRAAQGEAINQNSFTIAYLEWQYLKADKRRNLQQINDLQCAACSPWPHTLHIDANMKIYVWNRQRQPRRKSYHNGVLFQDSDECRDHMQDIERYA